MLITRRGWLVLLLGIFGAWAAHRVGQPVLLTILTMSLAAMAVSVLALLRVGGGLEVDRVVPPEVFRGDPLPVRLRVRNGRTPKSLFFLVDEPRVRDRVTPVAVPVDSLEPGERRELVYEMPSGRRGLCQFQTVAIESQAPFGLISYRRSAEARGTTVILPKPGRVWDWDCPGGRRHSGIGIESLDRSGSTQEFYAVREYRPEDPMKHIHWKLTAKMREPMVREFQTTSSLEVEVVLNASRADYPAVSGVEILDAVCDLSASLCAELMRRGFFVRLWNMGRRIRPTLQESGQDHLKRILVELAGLEANRDEPFAEALAGVVGHFTPRAAVVCVTTYLSLPEAAPAVAHLSERGFHPQLMVVEPPREAEREAPRVPEDSVLGSIARAGSPGFRFRSDDDFALVHMAEHEARRVVFRGVEVAAPKGSWKRDPGTPP